MAEVGLNLHFPSQLMLNIGVTQLILKEHLHAQEYYEGLLHTEGNKLTTGQ